MFNFSHERADRDLRVTGQCGKRMAGDALHSTANGRHIEELREAIQISIFESEFEFAAGNAAEWMGLESGGALYGLFSPAGRPVISLLTPPGPGAIHKPAFFRPDLEHFRRTDELLRANFGVHYQGDWHVHGGEDVPRPSPGDVRHIQALASKNKRSCMVELIFNCMRVPQPHRRPAGTQRDESRAPAHGETTCRHPNSSYPNVARVRICSYVYTDAPAGHYVRSRIRVLPGISPLRKALLDNDLFRPPAGTSLFGLPMARISFDAADPPASNGLHGREIPTLLAEQFAALPSDVRAEARVLCRDGVAVFTLPIDKNGKVAAAYNLDPPHTLRALSLIPLASAEPIDLTAGVVHGPATRMQDVYDRAVSILHGSSDVSKDDDSPTALNRTVGRLSQNVRQPASRWRRRRLRSPEGGA